MREKLSREKLRAWAMAMNETDQVGWSGLPEACPIANYLASTGERWHVSSGAAWPCTEGDQKKFRLPAWVRVVIQQVDDCDGEITAKQFLALIDKELK